LKNLWGIREYGLWGLWVKRASTVVIPWFVSASHALQSFKLSTLARLVTLEGGHNREKCFSPLKRDIWPTLLRFFSCSWQPTFSWTDLLYSFWQLRPLLDRTRSSNIWDICCQDPKNPIESSSWFSLGTILWMAYAGLCHSIGMS